MEAGSADWLSFEAHLSLRTSPARIIDIRWTSFAGVLAPSSLLNIS